jgi:hypothetical protein
MSLENEYDSLAKRRTGMTHVSDPVSNPAAAHVGPAAREDLKTVAYWLTLGAAAGGLGGGLVGGVGGRIAMFVLRLTSSDSVRGVRSDDGFTIGQFGVLNSLQLLATTALMGCVFGLFVVAGRPFFPKQGMPAAWAVAGAMIGGAVLIHQDGVDFTLLEPHWLAVASFVAIPAAGAGLIAWLTELFPKFWWRKWKLTVLASVGAVPILVFFPIALFAILVGLAWLVAMQRPATRGFSEWRPARVAAITVFGALTTLGLVDLVRDTGAII